MSDGGAEASGTLSLIHPSDNRFDDSSFIPFANALLADGERLGTEDFDVVIELFLDGRPVAEGSGDRVFAIDELDIDWLLRTVATGLET